MSERFGNFVDKFNGGSLGARWTLLSGTTPPHTGGAIVATAAFNIAAGAAPPSMGDPTLGLFEGNFVLLDMTVTGAFSAGLYVHPEVFGSEYLGIDVYGDGTFGPAIEIYVDTVYHDGGVYDPDVHKAFRIREDEGIVYFEYWNGYTWIVMYDEATPAWLGSTDVRDSVGVSLNGSPGVGENVTIRSYNELSPSDTINFWCPSSATDPESDDLEDLGDFEIPITPPFTSQKNIVDIAFDPRTGILIRSQGGFGSFGEVPPTNTQFSVSSDCGNTWSEPIDFGAFIEGRYNDPPFNVFTIPTYFHVPVSIIPGAVAGQWLIFDFVGGYYLSEDNGSTFSARAMSGITPFQSGPNAVYYGLVGVDGSFNTRQITPYHYLDQEDPQIGYSFDATVPYLAGIRRAIGPNGEGGWENSLAPAPFASGGTGWAGSNTPPLLHGANGIWIAAVGWQSTFDDEDVETPAMRRNTSPTLGAGTWEAPFAPVSQAWVEDMYGGFKTGGSYGSAFLKFEFGHGKLRFIPQDGHPAGGRWWMMGMQDSLIYSDDNGVTWSNSLADHTANEDAMHPMLNWRASHALGYRYTPSKILDIVPDPLEAGRIISIGVTYDRAGISNRLAVFCCSTDGGNTWAGVGQLPIRLSNITSAGVGGDHDSPATARYGFPCVAGA